MLYGRAPSSGGQYHWVSEFAPPSMQKILSYASGYLAALGWQGFIATCSYTTAQQIFVTTSVYNPEFVPERWQSCLFVSVESRTQGNME
jgi:choline transport protein